MALDWKPIDRDKLISPESRRKYLVWLEEKRAKEILGQMQMRGIIVSTPKT